MQPPRQTGGTAEASAPRPGQEAVVEALQELYRAFHKATIYPDGHPLVDGALRNAHEALTVAFAGRDGLVIGVAKDHLLVDEGPLEGPAVTLGALARILHDLDVAALSLRRDLDLDQLKRLLFRLSAVRREGATGEALSEALGVQDLPSVSVSRIDYRGLSFSEYSEIKEGGAADSGEVWDHLVRTLTDPATYRAGGGPPPDLARLAIRQTEQRPGEGAAPLRRRMHALTRRMQGMSEEQRDALRARLVGFVSGLSEDLQRDLLRVDPGGSGEDVMLANELADSLPDPVLLEVLRGINRDGEQVPTHFLTFLSKVARISSESSSVGTELQNVLGRWGVSKDVLTGDATSIRSSLEEVFRQRDNTMFNPDTYQELLEDLATRELPQATEAVFARYRDPRDAVEVQAHVAEIAIRLLEDVGGTGDRAGLLGYLGAATDQLLEGGQYNSVRDAAVAARRIHQEDAAHEEARAAAAGYLRDLTDEQRIDLLLDRACRGESVPKAVAALLALGGPLALNRILDFLDRGPAARVAEMLEKLAIRLGEGPIGDAVETRWEGGWASLRPVFRVVGGLPPRDGVELLERLLDHPETRVRREALTVLVRVDRRAGSPERHLEQALADEDARLVVFAIQELFTLGRPASIELLGAYVEGSLPGIEPGLAFTRRAAQGLVALGKRGRRRLCGCLDALRLSLRPRTVRVGRLVRQVLLAHVDDPEVRRAVDRWRYSPAGLLSLATSSRGTGQEGDA